MEKPKIIPYDHWINSALSIARFFGGCTINGVRYKLDFENAPQTVGEDGEVRYKPNLLEVKQPKQKERKNEKK